MNTLQSTAEAKQLVLHITHPRSFITTPHVCCWCYLMYYYWHTNIAVHQGERRNRHNHTIGCVFLLSPVLLLRQQPLRRRDPPGHRSLMAKQERIRRFYPHWTIILTKNTPSRHYAKIFVILFTTVFNISANWAVVPHNNLNGVVLHIHIRIYPLIWAICANFPRFFDYLSLD